MATCRASGQEDPGRMSLARRLPAPGAIPSGCLLLLTINIATWRAGAYPGCDRNLRRHVLHGHAAHQRNRSAAL